MNELITLNRDGGVTMTSLEIAELVEKRHDNVKRTIETLANSGVIELPQFEEVKNHLGQTVSVYLVDKRSSYIVVAQLSPEFTARLVDRWQELEHSTRTNIPNFSNPADVARAWAIEYEKRELAESTKAEIGHRREATAMNTASQAVKKVTKLEQELDKSKQYVSIKRMTMIHHGQLFNWRLLKSTSSEMGLPSVDVFDQNYGSVKAYHCEVWQEAYAITAEGY